MMGEDEWIRSLRLLIRQIFHLIVHVVEQHTGMQLVLGYRFIRQFVAIATHSE